MRFLRAIPISLRNLTVYALLAAAWLLMAGWQLYEHNRLRSAAQQALLNRAQDISNSISAVIRAGRPGVIRLDRLEESLRELVRSEDLRSVALLNAMGDVVATAGAFPLPELPGLLQESVRWGADDVTIVNLVDFGIDADDRATTYPTIVWTGFDPDDDEEWEAARERFRREYRDRLSREDDETERPARTWRDLRGERARDDSGRPPFRRPHWMSPERYDDLLQRRGLHGFVLNLTTDLYRAEVRQDGWLRSVITMIGLLAAIGLGLAWHGMERSARLQLRLERAGNLNRHLQEMNLAAVGLAHETRNPLNLIRGLSQLIARAPEAGGEIGGRAREISDEVDRVTQRLNEFIQYSRPPEPRPGAIRLRSAIEEVAGTLAGDLQDKQIELVVTGQDLTVQADESLLRQVLFNLLINAVQALEAGRRIEVRIDPNAADGVALEVCDDGPGVPPDIREAIFRPYFTTRPDGTGLGLAVVSQIALAHHWDIEFFPNEPTGACFRLSGLARASR